MKDERMERILALKRELKNRYLDEHIGATEEVVPEEEEDGYTVGYTGNYIRCYIKTPFVREKIKVKIIEKYKDGVIAEGV